MMKKDENKLAIAADDACATLREIMRDKDAKSGDRIHAAEVLIDRGYGRGEAANTVVFVGESEI